MTVGGTDQVYGLNVSRFLADNDRGRPARPELYGTLGAALTPGTYVSGEAASVTPLNGERYRTMYLPPNNDTAATFLETLRLTLVHETRGPEGEARGLELAFATPRSWLADGKSIAVDGAPTSFGPLSYSVARSGTPFASRSSHRHARRACFSFGSACRPARQSRALTSTAVTHRSTGRRGRSPSRTARRAAMPSSAGRCRGRAAFGPARTRSSHCPGCSAT